MSYTPNAHPHESTLAEQFAIQVLARLLGVRIHIIGPSSADPAAQATILCLKDESGGGISVKINNFTNKIESATKYLDKTALAEWTWL